MSNSSKVRFTPEQESAIDYRRMDACVVAGPGSGKTTVLVERFRELIEVHHLDVREILAITFTEKAAANMKAKLRDKFQHDPFRRRELESAWVSTIHGFCARFLRENAIAAEIDPRFTVLDARESELLQYECMNRALDELVEQDRDLALALIAALQRADVAGDLRSCWDAIRSSGRTVADVRTMQPPPQITTLEWAIWRLRGILKRWPPAGELTKARIKMAEDLAAWAERLESAEGFAPTICALREKVLHLGKVPAALHTELETFKGLLQEVESSIVDKYTAPFRTAIFDVMERYEILYGSRKAELGALDFNDLERCAIGALRTDAVRDRVRQQFRQILLDEFQDINEQQAELIQLIRDEDVFFAVGDVNQSIYGFRHARPEIFHAYRQHIRETGKHSTELLHNFRSRVDILRCVENLLNEESGIEPRELVAGREFDDTDEPVVEVLKVFHEDREQGSIREAGWIARRILDLASEGYGFRDFAVLCRNGDSMGPILEAFDVAGIPYVCGRRESFVASREGLDIAALLGTIANPQDWISKATLLRSRLVGLSDEGLVRARTIGSGYSGTFTDDDAAKLGRFEAGLRRWRSMVGLVSLDVLISRVLDDCGFLWEPGSTTGENVEAFLHLARLRGGNRTLEAFLHDLKGIEGAASAEAELSDDDQGNRVQVMTTHAAKGLEFPVTIVAAMEKGPQRSSAPVTFTPEVGLGIRWKDPSSDKPNADGLKDSWAHANSERLKARERDEGNRLLYVAMTRAEERLILSYSRNDRATTHWAKMVERCAFPWKIHDLDTDAPDLAGAAVRLREPVELEVVQRPVLRSQHDSSVNVTSLTVFGNCPRKYYLQRYLGAQGGRRVRFDPEVSEPKGAEPEDAGAAELGSSVHEALAGKPGDYHPAGLELADVFRQGELGRRAEAAQTVEREWEFIAELEDSMVRGSIDLWFEDAEGLAVVDYKTDTLSAKDVPERAAEYETQLATYALALQKALGKRPEWGYLHFLRPNVIWKVRLDDGRVEQAASLIRELRDAQDWQEFEMKPGPKCQRCQYFKGMCPGELPAES